MLFEIFCVLRFSIKCKNKVKITRKALVDKSYLFAQYPKASCNTCKIVSRNSKSAEEDEYKNEVRKNNSRFPTERRTVIR